MSGATFGALRHRVVLERLDTLPDGGGGVAESWVADATLWASITPLTGGEAITAGRLAGRHRYEIRIRYRADVNPAMRFRKGSRIFHILAVEDVGERGIWLKALCEEREL